MKFVKMEIDDVFLSQSLELPFELMVTCFFVSGNKDKEWNFFLNMN